MTKYEPGMEITPFEVYQHGTKIFWEDTGKTRTTVEIEGEMITIQMIIGGDRQDNVTLFPREAAILAEILTDFLIGFAAKYKKDVG